MQNVVQIDFKDLNKFGSRYKFFKNRGVPLVARNVLNRLAKTARFDYIPASWGEAVTVRKKTFLTSHMKYSLAKGSDISSMQSAAGVVANKKLSQNFAEIETGGASTGGLWMQLAARIGGDNARRVSAKYKDVIAKAQNEAVPGWQMLYRDINRTLMISDNGALIEIAGKRKGKRSKRGSVTTSPAERRAYNKNHYPFVALTSGTGFKVNKERRFVKKAGAAAVSENLRRFYKSELKKAVLNIFSK